jgi:hypothetical protein
MERVETPAFMHFRFTPATVADQNVIRRFVPLAVMGMLCRRACPAFILT